MSTLSQSQTKKLVNTVMSAFAEFAAKDVEIEAHVIKACEAIKKLIDANAIASDIKPKALGQMFFGEDYKGDKSKPTPQLNFIRRIVDRLRGAGVLVTPERKKPAKIIKLPTLDELKALAQLEPEAAVSFADEILFDLTEKELTAIINMLKACVA